MEHTQLAAVARIGLERLEGPFAGAAFVVTQIKAIEEHTVLVVNHTVVSHFVAGVKITVVERIKVTRMDLEELVDNHKDFAASWLATLEQPLEKLVEEP